VERPSRLLTGPTLHPTGLAWSIQPVGRLIRPAQTPHSRGRLPYAPLQYPLKSLTLTPKAKIAINSRSGQAAVVQLSLRNPGHQDKQNGLKNFSWISSGRLRRGEGGKGKIVLKASHWAPLKIFMPLFYKNASSL